MTEPIQMPFIHLAMTNMDVVIGVVAVVFWIISQVASRKKGSQTPPTPPPSGDDEAAKPQDALRQFFEDLEKGMAQPRPKVDEAPPPPVPPPHRTNPHPSPTRKPVHQAPRQRPVMIAQPQRAPHMTVAPEPVPIALASFAETAAALPSISTVPIMTSFSAPTHPIVQEIRNPNTLRQMIIASEILQPPIALRRSNPGRP